MIRNTNQIDIRGVIQWHPNHPNWKLVKPKEYRLTFRKSRRSINVNYYFFSRFHKMYIFKLKCEEWICLLRNVRDVRSKSQAYSHLQFKLISWDGKWDLSITWSMFSNHFNMQFYIKFQPSNLIHMMFEKCRVNTDKNRCWKSSNKIPIRYMKFIRTLGKNNWLHLQQIMRLFWHVEMAKIGVKLAYSWLKYNA